MDSLYFSKKRDMANREFSYFQGSVDPSCRAFNEGTMFEEFDGFSGIASNKLRGFQNASGCGSYNASGKRGFVVGETYNTAPASRQTGGDCTPPNVYCKAGDYFGCHPPHKCNDAGARKRRPKAGTATTVAAREVNAGMNDCGQRCGSAYPNRYRCPDGCMCDGKGRGTCVPVKGRLSSNDATARNINFSASGRKSRRASMDRLSINPVRGRANFRGFNASGCGNYIN